MSGSNRSTELDVSHNTNPRMLAWIRSFRPRERALLAVAIFWILLFLSSFAAATIPVRVANSDDVDYQKMEDAGRSWEDSIAQAHAQGRFYMPMAFGPIAALYSIHDPVLFTCVRTGLLLLQVAAFGTLIATVTHSRILALRVAVVLLLLLEITFPFNLTLSYPETGLGFTMFCLSASLLFSQTWSRTIPVMVAAGFFFASWLNEDFVAPTLLLSTAACFQKPRRSFAIGGAVSSMMVYLAIYFTFRTRHPSLYPGTQFSLNCPDVLNVLIRQIGATFPGVELVMHRYGFEPHGFFKSPTVITHLLLHPGWISIALILSGVAIWAKLGKLVSDPAPKLPLSAVGWAILTAIAFVVPIALTEKYQAWTHLRQYPYGYAFYSWAFLVGAFCLGFERFRRAPKSPFFGKSGQVAAILALTIGAWSAAASNRHVIEVLKQATYPLSNDTMRRLGLGEGWTPGKSSIR